MRNPTDDPMGNAPLAVAISALIRDNKILLIKRAKGDYIGLLGMPGGKIEQNEHASDAATREILEETGIESDVKKFMGIISEHLIENNEMLKHFLLFLFELDPKTTKIAEDPSGKVEWVDLDEVKDMKDEIIPSDFEIIERMIKNAGEGYYNCVLEKVGDEHYLRKFEQISDNAHQD